MKKIYSFLLFIILTAAAAYTQQPISMRSTAKGFSGQVHIGYGEWSSDDFGVGTENGVNFGLKASWGFTEVIEAFVRFDYAMLIPEYDGFEMFPYSHLDFGGRFNLGSSIKPWRPFLQIAGTIMYSEQEAFNVYDDIVDIELTGFGLSLGGGIKYHLSLNLALLAGADMTFGSMHTIVIDGYEYDELYDANSVRVYLGIAYYL